MYYHVTIKLKSEHTYDEYKTDLTREQVISRYVEPYEQGESLLINGKTVTPDDLERIKFYCSENTIESYVPAIRAKNRNSSFITFSGQSDVRTAISQSSDVTDEFISGPLGYKKKLQNCTPSKKDHVLDKSKVFIVHGHDDTAKTKAARFVEQLGLEAIILHEQASSGRTIIEKIEYYSNVGFAIVLYTPDDIGNVKCKPDELKGRARQNVVLEHGFLIGKLGRGNVAALVEQPIELPNDISGVVYLNIDEANAWQLQLAKEMKQSGYNIDMNDLI